jgi:hypothetical protein
LAAKRPQTNGHGAGAGVKVPAPEELGAIATMSLEQVVCEVARRLYGYEPEEVIGRANSSGNRLEE